MIASVTLGKARRKANHDSNRMLTWPKVAFHTAFCSIFNIRPCGVFVGSVGRNTSEANGFALMYTLSSFTESMGVGESAYCILALWNIRRWRPLSSSENQGHGAPNGSHNITLQAQTSCSVGWSSFSKHPTTKLVNWWTLK